ncbi:MAG TPA: hypothetical protein VIC26_08860 [Marinagarivorans sp.]
MTTPTYLATKLTRLLAPIGCLIITAACANAPNMDEATLHALAPLTPQIAQVKPVEVTFASYWLREQSRDHTKADIAALQQRYSERLTAALVEALSAQGWQVSTTQTASSTGKTTVRARVDNMRITAPDFDGALVDLYANNEHGAGDFAVIFEKNGEIKAQFKDQRSVQAGAGGNQLTRTSRVINQQAFVRTFKRFIDDSFELASQEATQNP